jgi:hypothetical protein
MSFRSLFVRSFVCPINGTILFCCVNAYYLIIHTNQTFFLFYIRYAAFAHACGLIAEGKFACETNGTVTITWDHVLKLDGSEWKASTADAEKDVLLSEISLADGELVSFVKDCVCLTAEKQAFVLTQFLSLPCFHMIDAVQATKGENANKPVWGEGKEDPREALEETSFLMRKVVFHHGRTPRGRNRGNRNNKSNNNKNGGD